MISSQFNVDDGSWEVMIEFEDGHEVVVSRCAERDEAQEMAELLEEYVLERIIETLGDDDGN